MKMGRMLGVVWLGMLFTNERRRHFPVHPATGVILVFVAGLLLWANLRETGWQRKLGNLMPPAEADPITQIMFYRGWPLPPCLVCMFHGGKWHPEEGGVHLALLFDGVVFILTLLAVGAICERLGGKKGGFGSPVFLPVPLRSPNGEG